MSQTRHNTQNAHQSDCILTNQMVIDVFLFAICEAKIFYKNDCLYDL